MNVYAVAAVWVALALLASLTSIRLGISVALVEIIVGALAGNLPVVRDFVDQTEFTTFLATIGSLMLTFLAGAEIDPVSLRLHWKPSIEYGFHLNLAVGCSFRRERPRLSWSVTGPLSSVGRAQPW